MTQQNLPPGDDHPTRCPRLGHQIPFSYCLTENHGLPCFKTLDCWFNHFPVEEFLREKLSTEDWEKVFASPPKPKVLSLLELIEQAKSRNQE